MKDIKAEEYFSIGIGLAKKEYWTIFFNLIIYGFVAIGAAITIVGIFFLPAIGVGYITFLLKAARGEKVDLGDSLGAGFKDGMWWKSLLLSILSAFGIVLGFLLLIVPGVYLSVVWMLAVYLLVDKKLLPTDALGQSRDLVHQLGFWKVFVIVFLISIGTQLVSLLPFLGIIILLFIMPFTSMIYVAVYENAIKNDSVLPLEAGITE